MDDTWVGLWGCRQGKGAGLPPGGAGGEGRANTPPYPRGAVPSSHFPPVSLSSRHPGRCGTGTGPLFQWLKKDSASVGHLSVHGAAPQSPAGAQPRDPRPRGTPPMRLGLGWALTVSAAPSAGGGSGRVSCRHVPLSGSAAGASGGTRSPGARCGKFHTALAKIGQGPREESVCIFSGGASLFPQAQVESCWHFHPFNHRLRETLWEIAAGWRSRSEWDGLSPSEAQTARQSLSSGRGCAQAQTCLPGKIAELEVSYALDFESLVLVSSSGSRG